MSGNQHLIDNFLADKETKNLAHEYYRQVKAKSSGVGSSMIRDFAVGLPAACVLVAAERWKDDKVTLQMAQTASCLNPKDFRRLHGHVKALIQEADRSSCISYHELHVKYKLGTEVEDMLKPYITKTENELLMHAEDVDVETTLFKCTVFFWVISKVKPKLLPGTERFAVSHTIPFKSFCTLLSKLNLRAQDLQREIQSELKEELLAAARNPSRPGSPMKRTQSSFPSTNDTYAPQSAAVGDALESPSRRSSRTNPIPVELPTSIIRQSPRKPQVERSPTKVVQPPRLAHAPGRKPRVLRELPSKDSPKKQAVVDVQAEDGMDVDDPIPQTPTKKRKIESILQTRAISSRNPSASPTKKKGQSIFPSLPIPLVLEVDLPKQVEVVETEAEANPFLALVDSDDSDSDEPTGPQRRFRPVYLEHRQWYTPDPRLASIWKKANKTTKTPGS